MGRNNCIDQSHVNSLDEENFLTEMVQQQQSSFPFESGYHSSSTMQCNKNAFTIIDGGTTTLSYDEGQGKMLNNDIFNSNSIISHQDATSNNHIPNPNTFILSFSTMEQALHHEPSSPKLVDAPASAFLCKETSLNDYITEPKVKQQTNKKCRSSSEVNDHIMAERKRRQQLTERFIALSATIPGLKKTDKAYILREAINYMKQLQERVKELENENKRKTTESTVIFIKKSQVCSKEETTSSSSCETNSDRFKKALPQVEARVLEKEKEVLIGIHCEKQKDIVLRIMALLQNLHLSLASSSVLPFGTSTLKVTIIARMDDEYCMSVNDLVKNLRHDLLELHDIEE
ncbi:Myc-type, basic helix-loop-helix [Sesbania bispinosa]|nr:Myc-type, basic helix-loop-helix [Sesbania bispinosa]